MGFKPAPLTACSGSAAPTSHVHPMASACFPHHSLREFAVDLFEVVEKTCPSFCCFIKYRLSISNFNQIIFHKQIYVRINSPEVEICLIHNSRFAGTIHADSQNLRNNRMSASLHIFHPSIFQSDIPIRGPCFNAANCSADDRTDNFSIAFGTVFRWSIHGFKISDSLHSPQF